MFSYFSHCPGTDLLLQLWYSIPRQFLNLKCFPFVPLPFQMKSEISRPLFDPRNEGFIPRIALQWSIWVNNMQIYYNIFWFFYRNWIVPTWEKWSLMSEWIS